MSNHVFAMNGKEYYVWPGKSYPLGATWDGKGVNFAIFSENAENVDLCLFEKNSTENESVRFTLFEHTDMVWHCYIPGIKPGQHYGYRFYGQNNPKKGLRFNHSKLLIDPYAKAISGDLNWDGSIFGNNDKDSAGNVPRCVVVDGSFDWEGDSPPDIPLHRSVIYELHTKGFTWLNPHVRENKRGTYAGLSSPRVIEYVKSLGVTAVELLPIHHFISEKHLTDKGLTNYWGYNSLGYFAPDSRYSSTGSDGEQVDEFKSMVKAFHREGIEVILDVVYNHTCEGNHMGPSLSFRGIDNPSYYRLYSNDRSLYIDYTGCGNSLNMTHPRTLQLIMDSLRYWACEMHVDGFRFDLASTLARELHAVDKLGAFFDIIHQDPVLSRVKLIAEPWDLGEGGYQVGNFPVLWTEWNGKFRDTVRRYWKGDKGQIPELAFRISGSSDLYEQTGKKPYASVNYVTCHDGFTLQDLVTYEKKRNEANGENNRDGTDNNMNWNCGMEGVTDDPGINELRARQKRNMTATLLLSQGVPMLLAGDERSRTQQGNNNAYCQDNGISWVNWDDSLLDKNFFVFVKHMLKLRRDHPVLQRRKFFRGEKINGTVLKDIIWLKPDGEEMSQKDWYNHDMKSIGVKLNGNSIEELDEKGRTIEDDQLLILISSSGEDINFRLPSFGLDIGWELLIDTSAETGIRTIPQIRGGETYMLPSRSLSLFKLTGDVNV